MKRRVPVIDGEYRVVGSAPAYRRKELPRWFKVTVLALAALMYLTMLTMRAKGDLSPRAPGQAAPAAQSVGTAR